MMIAQIVYDVPAVIILNSCVKAITAWDLVTSMIKAWVFGAIISIVSPTSALQEALLCVLP
jgi:ABC-type transporter Mla maintaining outer membrane lipid asymmetry permease subunit MlaE